MYSFTNPKIFIEHLPTVAWHSPGDSNTNKPWILLLSFPSSGGGHEHMTEVLHIQRDQR
jgi:hypothetical protein